FDQMFDPVVGALILRREVNLQPAVRLPSCHPTWRLFGIENDRDLPGILSEALRDKIKQPAARFLQPARIHLLADHAERVNEIVPVDDVGVGHGKPPNSIGKLSIANCQLSIPHLTIAGRAQKKRGAVAYASSLWGSAEGAAGSGE